VFQAALTSAAKATVEPSAPYASVRQTKGRKLSEINSKSSPMIIRLIMSIVATLLAMAHFLFPQLKLDMVTVSLVALAVVPWLAPIVKSIELPGGFKLELQELAKVSEQAIDSGLIQSDNTENMHEFWFIRLTNEDPKLAFAALRVEIEKRLRKLADHQGLKDDFKSLGDVLLYLMLTEEISLEQKDVFSKVFEIVRDAYHGAEINSEAIQWAKNTGVGLLIYLDNKIEQIKKEPSASLQPTAKAAVE
jgi:hypothetical protein